MNHLATEGTQQERANVVPFPPRREATASTPANRLRGPDPAGIATLRGTCPWTDELSDYDRRHIDIFARLLHDESEGASEDDLAQGIFALDPYRNRSRVLAIVRSHLTRAHWIADTLFPMLGW